MINTDKENKGGFMKKLSVLFILLFVTSLLFSVEIVEEKNYEYDISNYSKSIKIAKLWTTENFENSKDAIQLYDEEINTLVLNSNIMVWVMPLYYTMKIQIKDNKLIIKFNNFSAGTLKNKLSKSTTGISNLYENCDKLAESLFKYYTEY